MSIVIRKVLPEEANKYTALHIACWRDAYTGIMPDEYLNNMSAELEQKAERCKMAIDEQGDCEFFCAIHNDDMIGRLIFGKSNDEDKPDAGDVFAIYLLADYWGKGYGKQMMDFAASELKRSGYQETIIWVLEENTRGRQFYERYGFVLDGTKKVMELGKSLTCVRYVLSFDHL